MIGMGVGWVIMLVAVAFTKGFPEVAIIGAAGFVIGSMGLLVFKMRQGDDAAWVASGPILTVQLPIGRTEFRRQKLSTMTNNLRSVEIRSEFSAAAEGTIHTLILVLEQIGAEVGVEVACSQNKEAIDKLAQLLSETLSLPLHSPNHPRSQNIVKSPPPRQAMTVNANG